MNIGLGEISVETNKYLKSKEYLFPEVTSGLALHLGSHTLLEKLSFTIFHSRSSWSKAQALWLKDFLELKTWLPHLVNDFEKIIQLFCFRVLSCVKWRS